MSKWPIMSLGDIVLPTEQRDPKANPASEFSYVDIASVDNMSKAIVATKQFAGADAPSRARKVIRTGDIIVSTVRPNLNAVALVPANLNNQICSTGFSVLRPSEKVMGGYLFAFARSPVFINSLVSKTTGANYPAVNDGEVKAVSVPVPPFPEQERIVKLLDEADALRKLRNQADKRSEELIPALFNEMFGDPIANQMAWQMVNINEACTRVTDGTHDTPAYVNVGIPLITSKNLRSGNIDFSDAQNISLADHKNIIKRSNAEHGDILFAMIGTIGNAAVVPYGKDFSIKNVGLFKPNHTRTTTEYLHTFLCYPSFVSQLMDSAKGGTQKFVGLGMLRSIRLPLPPIALQREFSSRVLEIRAMESEQSSSRQSLDALFQSMLYRAFQGDL